MALRRKAQSQDTRVPKSKAFQNKKRLGPRAWEGVCRDHRGVPKRVYRTKELADRAAIALMLTGTEDDRLPLHTINAYPCSACSGYHVGHSQSRVK